MSYSIQVKIDGRKTTLRWQDYTKGKGHKYLDEQKKYNAFVRHYFFTRLSELPVGFSFKKSGRVYEIIE